MFSKNILMLQLLLRNNVATKISIHNHLSATIWNKNSNLNQLRQNIFLLCNQFSQTWNFLLLHFSSNPMAWEKKRKKIKDAYRDHCECWRRGHEDKSEPYRMHKPLYHPIEFPCVPFSLPPLNYELLKYREKKSKLNSYKQNKLN